MMGIPTRNKPTNLEATNFSFQKGDVFIVQDSNGETNTHWFISKGQRLFRNDRPEMVHAGIMLDNENTIEAAGGGLSHFRLTDIHGQKVIVFRCKDQRVSDLAADLAYNMERNYLAEQYPQLAVSNSENIKYALLRAAQSGYSANRSETSRQQLTELETLINSFDFKNNRAIENKLFCSELIVLIFSMSQLILNDGKHNSAERMPMECSLHSTNPSQLHEYLRRQPDLWNRMELQLKRQQDGITLTPVSQDVRAPARSLFFSNQPSQRKSTGEQSETNTNAYLPQHGPG